MDVLVGRFVVVKVLAVEVVELNIVVKTDLLVEVVNVAEEIVLVVVVVVMFLNVSLREIISQVKKRMATYQNFTLAQNHSRFFDNYYIDLQYSIFQTSLYRSRDKNSLYIHQEHKTRSISSVWFHLYSELLPKLVKH